MHNFPSLVDQYFRGASAFDFSGLADFSATAGLADFFSGLADLSGLADFSATGLADFSVLAGFGGGDGLAGGLSLVTTTGLSSFLSTESTER